MRREGRKKGDVKYAENLQRCMMVNEMYGRYISPCLLFIGSDTPLFLLIMFRNVFF